jgi:hypothetical protein
MENQYQQTFIYKISCKDETIKDCYVGHSTNISQRKTEHKHNCKNEKNKAYHYRIYEFIRSNGGWDNFKMEIVEHFPCETKGEAMVRENQVAVELNATLGIKAYRTKEQEIIYKAKWFQENKEKIKEKNTVEYICECGAVIQDNEKIRHFKSKTHLAIMNNEQLWLYPYDCSCGKHIIKNKTRHDSSLFHINNSK